MPLKERLSLELSLQRQEQTIAGWGTSLCWWGNIIGRWSNGKAVEELCRLLFDPTDGLGVNTLRYNLGAGENPPNKKHLRAGADMPCCLPEPRQWEWKNDEPQRRILKQAGECGADIFEVFLNSPPLWMTKSDSTAGAEDGLCNLKPELLEELAEYLAESAARLQQECGVPIASIAPFNEPISFWWKSTNDQEGCHFDVEQQSRLLEALAPRLRQKGLCGTGISAPECWSTFESIYCCNHYSAEAIRCVTQINTHAYFSDRQSRNELYEVAKRLKKPLWMSEVTCGGTRAHSHEEMSGALELAAHIAVHLNEMHAVGWVYWQAVENERMGHNHGLIHANFEGEERFFLTKQYYAFGNYTRFIRPGFTVLACDTPGIVAARSPETGQIVVVAANAAETEKTLKISVSAPRAMPCTRAYRTSAAENLRPVAVDGGDEFCLPPESVTTFLLE